MGYRSEVVIAIKKEVYTRDILLTEKFPSFLRDVDENAFTLTKFKDYYIYQMDQIKWYEGYDFVDETMEYLDALEDEEYGFIRIGEETTDIEQEGSPWEFGIEVYSSVHIEGID